MEVLTRTKPSDRMAVLLGAWASSSDGVDIKLRTGKVETGEPCILVSIGKVDVPMAVSEANAFIYAARKNIELLPGIDDLLDAMDRACRASAA